MAATQSIENVPETLKDWHPGSNNQVLNLVHPSLYPLVYGRTVRRSTGEAYQPPNVESYSISQKFQWLPSDFCVSETGEVVLNSPYINNIDPVHNKKLYDVLPKIIGLAIPLFERVLSDLRRPLLPWRIKTRPLRSSLFDQSVDCAPCLWGDEGEWPEPTDDDDDSEDEEEPLARSRELFDQDRNAWYAIQDKRLPEVKGSYDGDLEAVEKTVSLNGSTIQCIVKLANIVLTPEKPEYTGGKWHVEGTTGARQLNVF